jgi:hypothetical protein
MWDPQHTTTLQASTACYGDNWTHHSTGWKRVFSFTTRPLYLRATGRRRGREGHSMHSLSYPGSRHLNAGRPKQLCEGCMTLLWQANQQADRWRKGPLRSPPGKRRLWTRVRGIAASRQGASTLVQATGPRPSRRTLGGQPDAHWAGDRDPKDHTALGPSCQAKPKTRPGDRPSLIGEVSANFCR